MAKLNQGYKDRGKHKNRNEAFFALVGYTIGLGNLWRFSYRLGLYGVTFLIPYGVFLVFVGVPLYILELALGQYISLGPIHVFTFMSPLFKGLGWAMLLSLVLAVVYYNVILAWAVYYIVASFGPSSRLPWSLCTNHNNNIRNTTALDTLAGDFTLVRDVTLEGDVTEILPEEVCVIMSGSGWLASASFWLYLLLLITLCSFF
ncbi:hypothetical protein Pcinc_006367 [Petrolisthes cinctipes]|uniref:Sodium-dependent nutrient amino acid transporter 1 n=1 Tax=Petrolisthes cinctipes TaxID=88211 RepID=A0AAE1GAT2_PETCI|nr:hypothetical protein Pcinc_006367 [Petrolisthes cinctipes]